MWGPEGCIGRGGVFPVVHSNLGLRMAVTNDGRFAHNLPHMYRQSFDQSGGVVDVRALFIRQNGRADVDCSCEASLGFVFTCNK